VAIYRLIANGSFGPDEIEAMTTAYEGALIDLKCADRNDPLTDPYREGSCKRDSDRRA